MVEECVVRRWMVEERVSQEMDGRGTCVRRWIVEERVSQEMDGRGMCGSGDGW